MLDLVLRPRHFRLAAIHACLRPGAVVRHFGDFERRQQLAFFDAIANVHVDVLHVAGDLGHEVDFLIRLELRGEDHAARQIFDGGFGDRDRRGIRRFRGARLDRRASGTGVAEQSGERRRLEQQN